MAPSPGALAEAILEGRRRVPAGRAVLVAVTGIDGSGKGHVTAGLEAALRARGARVAAILADRPHPEQGYRSCLGILRLAKRYDPARLEAACARALAAGARSYRHVDAILKRGLERAAAAADPVAAPVTVPHENIRGRDYYH